MFLSWLAMIGITALSLGGGIGLWRLHQRTNLQTKALEARLRALQDDVAALCVCQVGTVERDQARKRLLEQQASMIESRVEAMEQRLRQIVRRQDEQLHTGEPGETSYGAAIRLAHQGADVAQLVNTFGLARGEAELIAALHRASNEPQAK